METVTAGAADSVADVTVLAKLLATSAAVAERLKWRRTLINLNIYEYFNSQDVAEHCQNLGHSFTGRELAYMIWQSNRHTLAQKIAAWEELIRTVPDEELEDGGGLHHFLRSYITRLKQFVSEFQANTDGCAYSYETLYTHAPERYLDESVLYASYDDCLSATTAEVKEAILSFCIRKKLIHNQSADRMGDAMLYLTPNGEPMGVFVAPYYGEINLLVEPFGFYGWCVEIPTPFKRGDIVTGIDLWGRRSGPMVVDKLPDGNGEDYIDMCAYLWDLDHQGRLCHNEDICYLSLEYYHGDLEKQGRFLYALHNYCKDELPMTELLRSYSVALLEFCAEKRMDFYGWEEGAHRLSGLVEETIHIS